MTEPNDLRPPLQAQPAGQQPYSYQPAAARPPAGHVRNAGNSTNARKIIVAGVVVVLLIIVWIVAHAVTSGNSISAGDCVVTNPNALTGWDIKKVGCDSSQGVGVTVQKVMSVQSGSDGECDLGLTTFQDQPGNETYCLEGDPFGIDG